MAAHLHSDKTELSHDLSKQGGFITTPDLAVASNAPKPAPLSAAELTSEKDQQMDQATANAQARLGEQFPHGYTQILTASTDLMCGLFAIRESLQAQYPQLPAPDIQDLKLIANSPQLDIRSRDTYTDSELARIFQQWATIQGYEDFVLAYIVEADFPYLSGYGPTDGPNARVLWIHNDNAQALSAGSEIAVVNHWSGVQPNLAPASSKSLTNGALAAASEPSPTAVIIANTGTEGKPRSQSQVEDALPETLPEDQPHAQSEQPQQRQGPSGLSAPINGLRRSKRNVKLTTKAEQQQQQPQKGPAGAPPRFRLLCPITDCNGSADTLTELNRHRVECHKGVKRFVTAQLTKIEFLRWLNGDTKASVPPEMKALYQHLLADTPSSSIPADANTTAPALKRKATEPPAGKSSKKPAVGQGIKDSNQDDASPGGDAVPDEARKKVVRFKSPEPNTLDGDDAGDELNGSTRQPDKTTVIAASPIRRSSRQKGQSVLKAVNKPTQGGKAVPKTKTQPRKKKQELVSNSVKEIRYSDGNLAPVYNNGKNTPKNPNRNGKMAQPKVDWSDYPDIQANSENLQDDLSTSAQPAAHTSESIIGDKHPGGILPPSASDLSDAHPDPIPSHWEGFEKTDVELQGALWAIIAKPFLTEAMSAVDAGCIKVTGRQPPNAKKTARNNQNPEPEKDTQENSQEEPQASLGMDAAQKKVNVLLLAAITYIANLQRTHGVLTQEHDRILKDREDEIAALIDLHPDGKALKLKDAEIGRMNELRRQYKLTMRLERELIDEEHTELRNERSELEQEREKIQEEREKLEEEKRAFEEQTRQQTEEDGASSGSADHSVEQGPNYL